MSQSSHSRHNALGTLRAFIHEMDVAMLTTTGPDQKLRSRPMILARHEFDGEIWFFALDTAPQIADLERHPNVNIARAGPTQHQFMSMCGTAEIVRDRQKLELLWKDELRKWFAEGWATPNLVLVRVAIEEAEYWDERAASTGGLLSAMVSWRPSLQRVHEKILWDDQTTPADDNRTDEGKAVAEREIKR